MVLVEELDGIEKQASRRRNNLIGVLHQPLASNSWHVGFSSRSKTVENSQNAQRAGASNPP
jgi:hypothetical protein